MSTEVMDAWVGRVLGIQPGTANAGAGSISIMRLGKARIEWIAVRRNAQAGIGRLRDAIADEFADDEEQAVQLANALSDLGERIDWLDATLEQQLDAVLTADAAKRPPLISTARATLDRFTSLLAGDPILKAIDGNDVLPEVVVVAPLQAALSNIASALG